MADPRFPQPEQDASGNGDLPTYDAVAAEAGPNSRSVRSCTVGWIAENLTLRIVLQVWSVEIVGREAVSTPCTSSEMWHIADWSWVEPPNGMQISHLKFWKGKEREDGVKTYAPGSHKLSIRLI